MKNKAQMLTLLINGQPVDVPIGTSVAAALRIAEMSGASGMAGMTQVAEGGEMVESDGLGITRISVKGQLRAPFCGMGICQECRVMIDGRRQLACQICCTPGMRVRALQ